MARIETTTDTQERESLMHEHMLAMLEEVKLLRTQTTGMKMAMSEGKKIASMDAGKSDDGQPEVKDQRGMMGGTMMGMHKTVERRLDMLEQLLEQVIKHAHQRGGAQHSSAETLLHQRLLSRRLREPRFQPRRRSRLSSIDMLVGRLDQPVHPRCGDITLGGGVAQRALHGKLA